MEPVSAPDPDPRGGAVITDKGAAVQVSPSAEQAEARPERPVEWVVAAAGRRPVAAVRREWRAVAAGWRAVAAAVAAQQRAPAGRTAWPARVAQGRAVVVWAGVPESRA